MIEPAADPARRPQIADYELVRRIGRGSYGDVWLARGVTGIWRAIKVVWRDRFSDAGPFEREFKGLKEFAEISLGESIQLALLHVGRNDAAGFFYYVMELADDAARGREIDPARYVPLTLAEVRARRGRVPAGECVTVGLELARGLAALHRRGLVHRDIKPSNVILVGGVPKLADIGLVAPAASAQTYVGTEGFVPPEGPGSPAADVYALGKVLYELATGLDRQEFPQLPAQLNRIQDHRVLLELNELILRACEPQPEQRYRDGAALLADLTALHAGRSRPARRAGRRTLIFAAAGLAVVGAGAVVWRYFPKSTPPAQTIAAPANDKSIAVLPFVNMSDDKENAFFADGVHEDVLTNLAGVSALTVISRPSMMQYREMTKPVKQIGRELDVAYVLAGSVRRAGNKVRVTAQLIRAASEVQVWARTYERDLKDVFAVQAELAREITGSLRATLTPAENNRLGAAPTNSLAAYDLVKQVRAMEERGWTADDQRERALPLLEQAVALDTNYAEAWAELSRINVNLYGMGERTEERLRLARSALAQADQLAPDAYRTLLAGASLGAVTKDRDMVNQRRDRIIKLFPGQAEAHLSMALTATYEKRWSDALAGYRRAMQLDPRNTSVLTGYFGMLRAGRHYEEAEAIGRLLLELRPENPVVRLDQAGILYEGRGSTEEIEQVAQELAAKGTQEKITIVARARLALRLGRSRDLVDLWRAAGTRFAFMPASDGVTELVLVAGALLEVGDDTNAQALLETALDRVSRTLATDPQPAARLNFLGLIHALRGDRARGAATLAKVRTLIEANPGAPWLQTVRWENAGFRAWVGETDEAIAELNRLLREPEALLWGNVHMMRRVWVMRPLQGNPKFEAMLQDPANNAPLF